MRFADTLHRGWMHATLTPHEHRLRFRTVSTVGSREFEDGCAAAFVVSRAAPTELVRVPCAAEDAAATKRPHSAS